MDQQKELILKERLEHDPSNAGLWFELGQVYFDDEWLDAIKCFSRCISIYPFCSDYYFNRGRKELSLNAFEMALADFTLAVRIDTETDMKWHYRGVAYFYLSMFAEAAECFKKSVELGAKYDGNLIPPSVDWTWMSYMKAGMPEAATDMLQYVDKDTKVGYEDRDYKTRVLLYKGEIAPDDFYSGVDRQDDLVGMAEVYGLSNYYYYIKHDVKRSLELLEEVIAYQDWHHAFAYKSALREIEVRRAENEREQRA